MTLQLIRDYLLTQGAITALVAQRIFVSVIPQDTEMPALVLSLVSDTPINSLCGYSDLRNGQVQIDCYARDSASAGGYQNANALAEVVESALRDKQVLNSICVARRDGYEPQTMFHRISLDFSTWRTT